jgi:aldose 1-epimerase
MESVQLQRLGDQQIAILRDEQAGTEARVLTSYGFNLYSFRVPVGERVYDLLRAEDHFADHPTRPMGNGNPLLFPFPNRIRGGKFVWEGRTYELPRNERNVHAIHGLVLDKPWEARVLPRRTAIRGAFRLSKHAPKRVTYWPSDFLLEATFELQGTTLKMEFSVTNMGASSLPWGFGIHPYFRLPLAQPGDERECLVHVPAAALWELEDFLPTSRILPVPPDLDLRQPRRFSELTLDHVYTSLAFEGAWCRCWIEDSLLKLRVSLRFDKTYRELVVYTPPTRDAICLEPYTCVTDAVNLHARGVDAGLRVLKPGQSAPAGVMLLEAQRL